MRPKTTTRESVDSKTTLLDGLRDGPVVNRWNFSQVEQDETARLLRALQNDALKIERSSIMRKSRGAPRKRNEADVAFDLARCRALDRSGGRDAGGGFDPYDHSSKPRRR
jgi:hypothetical protein